MTFALIWIVGAVYWADALTPDSTPPETVTWRDWAWGVGVGVLWPLWLPVALCAVVYWELSDG
ncbi:MAG: hypothetical protein AAGF55_01055 [Pseudomonadota bacterium]